VNERSACEACLVRAWLLCRLGGHLDRVRHRVPAVLELRDEALIAALGGAGVGEIRAEWAACDVGQIEAAVTAAGAQSVCRHGEGYPRALEDLPAPPAALFLRGEPMYLPSSEPVGVALVGSRRASPYGAELARSLGGRLGAAGVRVLSGMALGIDSLAHEGALAAGGATIAVLPAGPEHPYPPSRRALHRRIVAGGLAISELPPGSRIWRWGFIARNRLIAGLARATVVIEAGGRSGALVTARLAKEIGRPVGAVPGRVSAPGSAGPHRLIADGARLVTDARDVIELAYGPDGPQMAGAGPQRSPLSPELSTLLHEIAGGRDTAGALEAVGVEPERGLAALAALELAGYILREPGGRYAVSPGTLPVEAADPVRRQLGD
jgi:DNA processing protein